MRVALPASLLNVRTVRLYQGGTTVATAAATATTTATTWCFTPSQPSSVVSGQNVRTVSK